MNDDQAPEDPEWIGDMLRTMAGTVAGMMQPGGIAASTGGLPTVRIVVGRPGRQRVRLVVGVEPAEDDDE